jgi:hypothetical protein
VFGTADLLVRGTTGLKFADASVTYGVWPFVDGGDVMVSSTVSRVGTFWLEFLALPPFCGEVTTSSEMSWVPFEDGGF